MATKRKRGSALPTVCYENCVTEKFGLVSSYQRYWWLEEYAPQVFIFDSVRWVAGVGTDGLFACFLPNEAKEPDANPADTFGVIVQSSFEPLKSLYAEAEQCKTNFLFESAPSYNYAFRKCRCAKQDKCQYSILRRVFLSSLEKLSAVTDAWTIDPVRLGQCPPRMRDCVARLSTPSEVQKWRNARVPYLRKLTCIVCRNPLSCGDYQPLDPETAQDGVLCGSRRFLSHSKACTINPAPNRSPLRIRWNHGPCVEMVFGTDITVGPPLMEPIEETPEDVAAAKAAMDAQLKFKDSLKK